MISFCGKEIYTYWDVFAGYVRLELISVEYLFADRPESLFSFIICRTKLVVSSLNSAHLRIAHQLCSSFRFVLRFAKHDLLSVFGSHPFFKLGLQN